MPAPPRTRKGGRPRSRPEDLRSRLKLIPLNVAEIGFLVEAAKAASISTNGAFAPWARAALLTEAETVLGRKFKNGN